MIWISQIQGEINGYFNIDIWSHLYCWDNQSVTLDTFNLFKSYFDCIYFSVYIGREKYHSMQQLFNSVASNNPVEPNAEKCKETESKLFNTANVVILDSAVATPKNEKSLRVSTSGKVVKVRIVILILSTCYIKLGFHYVYKTSSFRTLNYNLN